MIIYLVRHGDPDYANDTITPKGHGEAAAVAQRMTIIKPERIYTSPLGRARATMQYTADTLDMPFEVLDWTREISGFTVDFDKWGRIAAWNTPGEEIHGAEPFPDRDTWFDAAYLKGIPAKDTYDKIVEGSDAFLRNHGYIRDGGLYRVEKSAKDGERVALFAHAGFGLTWLAHLLQIPVPLVWCGFYLPTSSVTTILLERRSEEWAFPRLLGVGDVSHLYGSGFDFPCTRSIFDKGM